MVIMSLPEADRIDDLSEGHDALLGRLYAKAVGRRALAEEAKKYHVYFVQQVKTLRIKIGVSADVDTRIADLQCSSPESLRLLASIGVDDPRQEKDIHRRFAHLRIRGEWFRPGQDLLDYIVSLAPVTRMAALDADTDYLQ